MATRPLGWVASFLLVLAAHSFAYADDPEPIPYIPPPIAGSEMAALPQSVAQATEAEAGPSKPFPGLATGIEVDPQFGTAKAGIRIEIPPGRKLTPDLTVHYSSCKRWQGQ